jgi:hypothetical protein
MVADGEDRVCPDCGGEMTWWWCSECLVPDDPEDTCWRHEERGLRGCWHCIECGWEEDGEEATDG